jgi:hypothetical protein
MRAKKGAEGEPIEDQSAKGEAEEENLIPYSDIREKLKEYLEGAQYGCLCSS